MTEWHNGIVRISIPTPFPVGDVNVFLIKGDLLTLVDTGVKTPAGRYALEEGLKKLGYKLEDIEQVIITHHHPDHVGGADFFGMNVPLAGHPNNQRWLELSEDFISQLDEFFLDFASLAGIPSEMKHHVKKFRGALKYNCDRTLTNMITDKQELPGLPGWMAVETLGHAQSHLSFFREQDGAMIGGDFLLEKISPNPLIEPPFEPGKDRPRPQLQFNASLRKLIAMPVSKVYAGHGDEVENVKELANLRINRQHERAMHVRQLVENKPSTAYELCTLLFPKVFRKEPGLTLSETVAQLDYLLDLGEIKEEQSAHGNIYSVS
ncbi:MBL fold metallo-hydrolase [Peribacillus saganii]|uniref:MBL fold metallo-hydrolase n=1 Tax=Peribacillus saganii TaxID=2303992 RepID=A0A372L9M4_9BACI|nr:MBL fold metallo-hydrolase [Peribacillus saganii]RFU62308.1 MBL fold metallo-hydrolase [Peribacillus saganii]